METYSEDDFEESGDDGNDSDINMGDQTEISQEILAKTQAGQATELQRVVQAYNQILENTASANDSDAFSSINSALKEDQKKQQKDLRQNNHSTPIARARNSASGPSQVIQTDAIKPMSQRIQEQKQYIAEQMGAEIFQKILRILTIHKQNDSDSSQI